MERREGEEGRGISKSSRCKNSLEGEKETSKKNNIKKEKELTWKLNQQYLFFFIRCCMFDRYTNVYVPLCVPTSANWPFPPPVFMSGLHSLELQQCFLTQVLPCPHSYTAVIQACEWS